MILGYREKAKEFHEWLRTLEGEKYDHMEKLKRQKYEVSLSSVTHSQSLMYRMYTTQLFFVQDIKKYMANLMENLFFFVTSITSIKCDGMVCYEQLHEM